MKRLQPLFVAAIAVLALACGPKKAKAPAPITRDFPMVEIPRMIVEPTQRMEWLCSHFWDHYTATDSLYFCDSVTVNGVPIEQVEKQVGMFATLVEQIPLPEGKKAMSKLYGRLEEFQLAHPEGNVLPEVVSLISRYFYDPNSPVRSEDLYLPFVSELASSAFIREDYRAGYAWDAKICALNPTGSIATDFQFIDGAGHRRTLHSVKADKTLLIFGNPDCKACRELVNLMDGYPEIRTRIRDGSLKVVDIYIDEDIDGWKAHLADYPPQWVCGYDPSFSIRRDRLYSVRAIPSVYLLDAKKTVLLKDATPEKLLQALL
ncbi:MAG: DUF5106 domain-containing protein [Bacteroidales bacterium]|nr:DUF5106 domain-containing protein [Bacteroidales bacterium]